MTEKPSFYKTFFMIYFPLVLQNVITLSVNLADNIMLGAYSETALSGVAAANQIQFVYQQLLGALGDGLVIFCSQYWGKRSTEPMKKISVTAMHVALGIGIVLFTLISLFPYQAIHIFTTDEPIIAEGMKYLTIIRFTYLFFAITQILLATLRSTEVVRIALWLSVMTFFVNCSINYVLIFGHFGFPRLGCTGAAIGTLVARILETTVIILYLIKNNGQYAPQGIPTHGSEQCISQTASPESVPRLRLHLRDYLKKSDKTLRGDYLKTTLPILAVQGLWGLNTALQTVILGHMTAAAIAANSMASNLFLLAKSAAVGASSTASVIIGKTIGAGDIDLTKQYSRRLQRLFLMIGALSSIFLFFIRIPVLGLYQLTPATKEMANHFLIILSVVCFGMSYQMPTNIGIIRGGGNALFVVKLDLISIWLIVLPLSFFMAFVVKASPEVVICCLNADQIFKCIPAFLESHYGNWIRKLTRDN